MFLRYLFTRIIFVYFVTSNAAESVITCRDRSSHLRQDGGLCFEIPPWQHKPVELGHHLRKLREKWGNNTYVRRNLKTTQLVLVNSEISRYMDTVLAPYLDTYHRNIQNSYQQLTGKILRRIKDEINAAVRKKQQIYNDLTKLAEDLRVPDICDEERRAVRTVASKHVAHLYTCTEEARASITKMGSYAEDMIGITRNHMQNTMDNVAKSLEFEKKLNEKLSKSDVASCLQQLSRASVELGYELDLSLTNARRHNEQSCEKLAMCSTKVRRYTDEVVKELRDELYQCVYA